VIKYISTNERLIEDLELDSLSIYYHVLAKNINRILYPGHEQLAKKMRVDPTTISRWKKLLVNEGLATKDEKGFVVLVGPKDLIRKANTGAYPKHKCTLRIDDKDDLKEIKKKLRLKLFEKLYRQALFSSRETKTIRAGELKYGEIKSDRIRKKILVNSRMKLKFDGYVEMAVSTVAKRLDMSLRTTASFIKELKAQGLVSTRSQRSILHRDGVPIVMSEALYRRGKSDLGSSYRKPNGEVVLVRPNLLQLQCWSSPSPRPPARGTGAAVGATRA
jgi:Mn-dependent DtxR family transcriptional regulator